MRPAAGVQGWKSTLRNRIPSQAGMAGGSSGCRRCTARPEPALQSPSDCGGAVPHWQQNRRRRPLLCCRRLSASQKEPVTVSHHCLICPAVPLWSASLRLESARRRLFARPIQRPSLPRGYTGGVRCSEAVGSARPGAGPR